MQQIINPDTEAVLVNYWTETLNTDVEQQAKNTAELPFIFKNIAIMSNNSSSVGVPVGSVLATNSVVIPNAINSDIGCGVCAVKTTLKDITATDVQNMVDVITATIPIGTATQEVPLSKRFMPKGDLLYYRILNKGYVEAVNRLGTLGTSNHFIEIQKDDEGYIWIMVHSGSHNLGNKVSAYYSTLAKNINEYNLDPTLDLYGLTLWSQAAADYIFSMNYCIDFAKINRKIIISKIIEAINTVSYETEVDYVSFNENIDVVHGNGSFENHFGEEVFVHRKGAIRATANEIVIIPGDASTHSYIAVGKGEVNSFMSCANGSGANDIDTIMAAQADLIEIKTKLTPLATIKDQ